MAKLNDNARLLEELNKTISSGQFNRILILGDESLKVWSALKKVVSASNIPIEIYDPRGKITFKYSDKVREYIKNIIDDIWLGLSLDGLEKNDRLDKIQEAYEDPELMEEFEDAINTAVDTQRGGEFDILYATNPYFKKWIDKLLVKKEGKMSKISPEICKNFKDGIVDLRTVPELSGINDATLIVCVSNKIITEDLFVDVMNEIFTYRHRFIFFESSKDRLSMYHLLNFNPNAVFSKIPIRMNKKYEDYLILCNFK